MINFNFQLVEKDRVTSESYYYFLETLDFARSQLGMAVPSSNSVTFRAADECARRGKTEPESNLQHITGPELCERSKFGQNGCSASWRKSFSTMGIYRQTILAKLFTIGRSGKSRGDRRPKRRFSSGFRLRNHILRQIYVSTGGLYDEFSMTKAIRALETGARPLRIDELQIRRNAALASALGNGARNTASS